MPVIKKENIKLEPVASDKAKGVTKANVIGPNEGWADHTMRLFRRSGRRHDGKFVPQPLKTGTWPPAVLNAYGHSTGGGPSLNM